MRPLAVVLAALAVHAPGSSPRALIRASFGAGGLGACMQAIAWRESRDRPRAADWRDVHADGSRGSFGLFQIGALWRRRGESVQHFARRMFVPAANVREAHRLVVRYGLAPWGGC